MAKRDKPKYTAPKKPMVKAPSPEPEIKPEVPEVEAEEAEPVNRPKGRYTRNAMGDQDQPGGSSPAQRPRRPKGVPKSAPPKNFKSRQIIAPKLAQDPNSLWMIWSYKGPTFSDFVAKLRMSFKAGVLPVPVSHAVAVELVAGGYIEMEPYDPDKRVLGWNHRPDGLADVIYDYPPKE